MKNKMRDPVVTELNSEPALVFQLPLNIPAAIRRQRERGILPRRNCFADIQQGRERRGGGLCAIVGLKRGFQVFDTAGRPRTVGQRHLLQSIELILNCIGHGRNVSMVSRPCRHRRPVSLRSLNARIERRLHDVDGEVEEHEEDRQHQNRSLQDGEVTLEDRIVEQQARARP